MTDLLEYAGTLSDITYRTTHQGRHWATANLTHNGGVNEICIYPTAYEVVQGGIRDGATVTVSVRPPCGVAAINVGGIRWEEGPISNDTGKHPYAILAELGLPYGAEPVSVAQVIQAIQYRLPEWFKPRTFGRVALHGRVMTQAMLFFAQGHYLQHFHKPLFVEPMYAVADGVRVDLPEPGGEVPSNDQLNTIGYVLDRYSRMEPCDLRSLVRASGAWQGAYYDATTGHDGVIDLGLLREWFDRDEEQDDPASERPTRDEMREASAYFSTRQADQMRGEVA